ncbi:class II aldolase/adducin family protein [Phaeobacter gallaeciensis]|uniref:Ribulose-5-phosphate 4-epimerase n=1 Tax=Phaeobacter gallaeciensis TaxID=60890 RepID=A0AAD0EEZ0_9RHOB|nr:class II aldolase/adducin family protein [Phaeobacter gallaeciensis]AHD11869.1 Ribulose-5-phosphate 4-epimerase [Phaeobacter gallaeciensis DSM 26640]ATE95132.1 Ribulose-5-phosphate 4-epimerase [Phaeobacter gallaeciensis]ATE99440.1 Ribulose-5-phosphate 4-epimerase [Phaeobacter gallaeciensis]ATF03837.1 Ribulose-5-phosphate 4-epimerase [Phaeobacter gallaeciensis]ATF08030.1 Ribulose-5-phosphate 4-epimerase [Phaeobacter gallaeciensis]
MTEVQNDIALASRVLYAQGVLDAFGHVSVRASEGGFWMSRSMAPGLVTAPDVFLHDADGEITGNEVRPFLERFIHAEIYRARPDVMGIVHSHSPSVVPFSVLQDVPLRPMCHMCGFLHGSPVPHDISGIAGDASDLLIRSRSMGEDLARHMGDANVVLMRGHGFTVVGRSLREAVFRAVWTERGAHLQQSAMAMGTPQVSDRR